MLRDYDSIKSDYDIVTVMLKGPLIVNFRIKVLRLRKIGSIARYLCEYRGLGPKSFKLMCYNKRAEIQYYKKISSYCSSDVFKILVKVIPNLDFEIGDQDHIPEGGDDNNPGSSNKDDDVNRGGAGFGGGCEGGGGGSGNGGEGGGGGSGNGGEGGDGGDGGVGGGGSGNGGGDRGNGNVIMLNENRMNLNLEMFNSEHQKSSNNECFNGKWENCNLIIQKSNTFLNENINSSSLNFHESEHSSPLNYFSGFQKNNCYFYSFSKNKKAKKNY